jgi:branched-chain amino acid transport system substrate-binding protein
MKKTIKIGLVADLTGPMALYGGWVKKGAEIALEELALEGQTKSRPIELVIEDSRSNPTSAVNAIQKLITIQKIMFVITGNGSSETMAMAPIANENKTILFVTLASSPSITQAGDYVFRNRISGIFEAESMAKMAYERGYKKVAVAALNNESGVPYIEAFKVKFESLGGTITASELFTPETTDLRLQIVKLKEGAPEAVFAVLQIPQMANLLKQSTEQGFKPQWLGISSLKSEELIKLAGDITEGMIVASEGVDEKNPHYIAFRDKYKARFGEDPTIYAVNGYDAVKLLSKLIAEYGNDPEKVKNALYNLTGYVGAGGKLSFDRNGDAIREIKLFVVQNGKFVSL